MREKGLRGVVFGECRFRPMFQKHAGESCSGVFVGVDDRRAFRPFATYLELLATCSVSGGFDWRSDPYEFVAERRPPLSREPIEVQIG